MQLYIRFISLILVVLLTACSAPGKTREEQRAHVAKMKSEVLNELYKLKPDSRNEIRNAPGYAVFSNVNFNVIFASVGNGFGVVVDNSTGKQTHMKMGEVGLGIGLGAKDFRAVFVFDNREVMNRFVDNGWGFGGQADAAVKADEKGAAVAGEVMLDGIKIYQLIDTGLALQATIKGTRFWKDSELNQ